MQIKLVSSLLVLCFCAHAVFAASPFAVSAAASLLKERSASIKARQTDECTAFTFGVGIACDPSENECQDGLSCVYANSTTTQFTCELVTAQTTCVNSDQCGGLFEYCKDALTCASRGAPNDPCTVDNDCVSNSCGNDSRCAHKALGEACSGVDCALGSYCNPTTSVCTANIASGQDCTALLPGFDVTVIVTGCNNSMCDADLGTGAAVCTPFRSLGVNATCGLFGAFTCQKGLYCNTDERRCLPIPSNYNQSCFDGDSCDIGSCECNVQNATVAGNCVNHCEDESLTAVECQAKEGCILSSNYFAAGTCANKCLTQYKSALCCFSKVGPNYHILPGVTCGATTTGSATGGVTTTGNTDADSSSTGVSVQAFVALVVAAVVAAVAY